MSAETTYSFSSGCLVKTEATPGKLIATVTDGGQLDMAVRPVFHQVWEVGRSYYITRCWKGDAEPMLCTIGDGNKDGGTNSKEAAVRCAVDLQTFRDSVDTPVVTYATPKDCPATGPERG